MDGLKVKSTVNNNDIPLENMAGNVYEGSATAPRQELKTTDSEQTFPVSVAVTDDAGNTTVNNSQMLVVKNTFGFDFILANPRREELCFLEPESIDVDIGDTNDFEMTISLADYSDMYEYGGLIYIPDTEYGGIIMDREVATASNIVRFRGFTWRGYLDNKIVEPPAGEAYLTLNGDVNDVIRYLVKGKFDGLFVVPDKPAGVVLTGWKVDRYVSVLAAIMKMLETHGMRLIIQYKQRIKAVELQAVPIKDYSRQLEYSQDCNIDFKIRDCRRGVNHLICGGKGEGTERLILHLYVQQDGSIGDVPYYRGLDEIMRFYDNNNADNMEKLREDGVKRLLKLQNYKKLEMSVDNIDLELGDIVGGREYITGTEMKKPVVQKILKKADGRVSIQYKLKGAD